MSSVVAPSDPAPEPAVASGGRPHRRALRRGLGVGGGVAALLLGLVALPSGGTTADAVAGASPTAPTTTAVEARRVAVVGDSLTYMSAPRIHDALEAAGWEAEVRGDVGFTVGEQLDAVAEAGAGRPDVAVVALGTNDAFRVTDGVQTLSQTRADIARAMSSLADVPCLVWVDVTTRAPGPTWQANAARVDEMIEEALGSRPGGHVAHWDERSSTRRDWFLPDGVHHSERGKDAFAGLIASAVEACPS